MNLQGGRPSLLPTRRASLILQLPTSAGGAQEVSPAREGWVQLRRFDDSAVGATHAPAVCLTSDSRPNHRCITANMLQQGILFYREALALPTRSIALAHFRGCPLPEVCLPLPPGPAYSFGSACLGAVSE